MSVSEANAVCMQCGLCCDGTIFGSVVVAEVERKRVGRVGLRVVDGDGGLAMPQPCSALNGCLCSVYVDRPEACRRYECSLRERVASGSTTPEDAHANVARVRMLLATLHRSFGRVGIWEAIIAIDRAGPADPMSAAGRRYDAGVNAMSELLELTREMFGPALGPGR